MPALQPSLRQHRHHVADEADLDFSFWPADLARGRSALCPSIAEFAARPCRRRPAAPGRWAKLDELFGRVDLGQARQVDQLARGELARDEQLRVFVSVGKLQGGGPHVEADHFRAGPAAGLARSRVAAARKARRAMAKIEFRWFMGEPRLILPTKGSRRNASGLTGPAILF